MSGHLPPLVVMGVSGCGKSTVGALLGQRLGMPFFDGDDFHPAANKQTMAAGVPLADTGPGAVACPAGGVACREGRRRRGSPAC